MNNLNDNLAHSTGPLVAGNFRYNEKEIHHCLTNIAQHYDVTQINEKQKTAMSKELFDSGIISAIEHAILSLPNQHIQETVAKRDFTDQQVNLIDIYTSKVAASKHCSDMSAAKAIDKKFLFIMQDIHQQR